MMNSLSELSFASPCAETFCTWWQRKGWWETHSERPSPKEELEVGLQWDDVSQFYQKGSAESRIPLSPACPSHSITSRSTGLHSCFCCLVCFVQCSCFLKWVLVIFHCLPRTPSQAIPLTQPSEQLGLLVGAIPSPKLCSSQEPHILLSDSRWQRSRYKSGKFPMCSILAFSPNPLFCWETILSSSTALSSDGTDVSVFDKIQQIIFPFSSHHPIIIIKSLKTLHASNIGPISKLAFPKQMGVMFSLPMGEIALKSISNIHGEGKTHRCCWKSGHM